MFQNYLSAPHGEMDVKGMNYGPWMGEDHMASDQLFFIDMEAYGAKEKATNILILNVDDNSKLIDPRAISIDSVQGGGKNGDEWNTPTEATTPKKRQKQEPSDSDLMPHHVVVSKKKELSTAEDACQPHRQ